MGCCWETSWPSSTPLIRSASSFLHDICLDTVAGRAKKRIKTGQTFFGWFYYFRSLLFSYIFSKKKRVFVPIPFFLFHCMLYVLSVEIFLCRYDIVLDHFDRSYPAWKRMGGCLRACAVWLRFCGVRRLCIEFKSTKLWLFVLASEKIEAHWAMGTTEQNHKSFSSHIYRIISFFAVCGLVNGGGFLLTDFFCCSALVQYYTRILFITWMLVLCARFRAYCLPFHFALSFRLEART